MILDIILALFSVCLTIGFYTGALDWLIIWYGCAPEKQKAKMPGEKIMRVAYYCMLLMAVFEWLAVFMWCMHMRMIVDIIHIMVTIVFTAMLAITFYLAQIKGNNLLKKIGNKIKKNSVSNNSDIYSKEKEIIENNIIDDTTEKTEVEKVEHRSTQKKKNKANKDSKNNYKSKNQRIKEALNQRK